MASVSMKFAVLVVVVAVALLMAATTTTRAMPAASSSVNLFRSIARHNSSASRKMRRGYGPDGIIELSLFTFDLDYCTSELDLGYEWIILTIDTARTDTWVRDENCNVGCPAPKYWPENSKTYKKISDGFKLDYVDVSGPITLAGSLGTDDLFYGDALGGTTIKGVTFGIASKAERKLPDVMTTGVIGLGRQAKSQNQAPPLLSTMAKSGAIKKELFGLRLDRVDKHGLRTGMVTLGSVDDDYTKGLQYHLLLPKADAWEIGLTDVLLNGASLGYKRTALFDSASWTLRVPEKDAQEIYKKIPGSKRQENGIYSIPSDSNVVITLQFDDKQYPMKASDMCYQKRDKEPNCNAAIQAADTDIWSIGAPFLINVYTVFDNENKKIGLAQRGDY